MLQSSILRLISWGLLGLAVFNIYTSINGVPAFTRDARIEGVGGDWQTPIGAAHYYRGEYLFQLGHSISSNLDFVAVAAEGGVEDLDEPTILASSARAADLLNQSIAINPGNAYAWTSLAETQSTAGEIEAMRQSLTNSWMLAPNNLQLSLTRLTLAASIHDFSTGFEGFAEPLSDEEISSVKRDMRVLVAGQPRITESIGKISEFLSKILTEIESERKDETAG